MGRRDEVGYEVVVGAGTLRAPDGTATSFPHRWTPAGVTVQSAFTGAHLLHLAIAGCVRNDVYREAAELGVPVDGVRVAAGGGFDPATWASTGISYTVELSSPAPDADRARLLAAVDAVAEIPRAVRQGAPVVRAAR